jgi:hypothetical protein
VAGQIERVTVRLPAGFDDNNPGHLGKLLGAVTNAHGPGFAIEAIDLGAMRATATRTHDVARVEQADDKVTVRLPSAMRTPLRGRRPPRCTRTSTWTRVCR